MDLPTTHYDKPVDSRDSQKIAFYIFLVTIFCAPIVFLPSSYAPLDVVKTIFLGLAILLTALFYILGNFKTPRLVVPRFALSYATLGVILSLIISSLISGSIQKSFLGQGFEIGTASFLLLMFMACGIAKRCAVKNSESVFQIYSTFFISFVVLALFHIARFFGGADFLNLGILSTLTSTIAGKWYDFAIITGAAALLSFLSIKFLPLRKGLTRIILSSFIVAAILLFMVNATFIWVILALVVLLVGVYEYSTRPVKGTGVKKFFSRISLFTFIVFVVAVVFAWKGDVLVGPLMRSLKIEYTEPVLPWQLTLDVTANTLKESPFFGAGPNRFGYQYLRYKPQVVNQTPFWNAEFTSGFGLVPTFIATQGAVGTLLWLIFFILLAYEGIRALKRTTEPLKKFLLTSSFFTSVFLWITAFVYMPSHATLFLTFIFTGLFISALIRDGQVEEKELRLGGKNYSKLMKGISVLSLIVLILWLGAYAKKAIAITYFQKGIKTLNTTKSLDAAEKSFQKALVWNKADVYYQALSEITLLKINDLNREIEAESQTGSPDQKKIQQVVSLITQSVKYTKEAQKIDPNNYYNYIAEAHVSELGTSLKIPNAYENARVSYINALKTNPYNPALFLSLARLEASQGKSAEAEQAVGKALELKPNYTEAVFFLSQLQVAGNKLADAIISTKVAISLTPDQPLLYFQLGLLEYNGKNYTAAIAALEKAVSLNDQYANARYFLGLAYARMGNNEKALAQFTELVKTNPDNKEVSFILSNLKEGKSPFAEAKPPIDSKPEKRKTLPVTEKNGKKIP